MPACAVHHCRFSSTARSGLQRSWRARRELFTDAENALARCSEIETWLKGKSSYTHHSIQDEMFQLYGDATLRGILARAHKSQSFPVTVDGTQRTGVDLHSLRRWQPTATRGVRLLLHCRWNKGKHAGHLYKRLQKTMFAPGRLWVEQKQSLPELSKMRRTVGQSTLFEC